MSGQKKGVKKIVRTGRGFKQDHRAGEAASAVAYVRVDPELAFAISLTAHRMGMSKNALICLTMRRALGLNDYPDGFDPGGGRLAPEVAAAREMGKDVPEVVQAQIKRQEEAVSVPKIATKRIPAIPYGPGFPQFPGRRFVKPSSDPGTSVPVIPGKKNGVSSVEVPSSILSVEVKRGRGRQ